MRVLVHGLVGSEVRKLNSHKQKLKDVTIKKTTVKAGKKAMSMAGARTSGQQALSAALNPRRRYAEATDSSRRGETTHRMREAKRRTRRGEAT